jgi:hypothetical protein
MPVEEGTSASASPAASPTASPTASPRTSNGEEQIELQERGLSDGFLQAAEELQQITEEDLAVTPSLWRRLLNCLGRVLNAFLR